MEWKKRFRFRSTRLAYIASQDPATLAAVQADYPAVDSLRVADGLILAYAGAKFVCYAVKRVDGTITTAKLSQTER